MPDTSGTFFACGNILTSFGKFRSALFCVENGAGADQNSIPRGAYHAAKQKKSFIWLKTGTSSGRSSGTILLKGESLRRMAETVFTCRNNNRKPTGRKPCP